VCGASVRRRRYPSAIATASARRSPMSLSLAVVNVLIGSASSFMEGPFMRRIYLYLEKKKNPCGSALNFVRSVIEKYPMRIDRDQNRKTALQLARSIEGSFLRATFWQERLSRGLIMQRECNRGAPIEGICHALP